MRENLVLCDRCYIRDIHPTTGGHETTGLIKTYNDIYNRLHQSEHVQSSCKLKRIELFTNGKRSVEP